jgi:hypothetical protein
VRYNALKSTVTYVETHCIVLLNSSNIPKTKKYIMPKKLSKKTTFLRFSGNGIKFFLIFFLLLVYVLSKIVRKKVGGHNASFPITQSNKLFYSEFSTRVLP